MTPDLILSSLEDALRPLVVAEGGALFVSETPEETISLLSVSPKQWRCILQWASHQGDADTYGSSKVGEVSIILQCAKGLRVDRGADAHRPPVTAPEQRPILPLVALTGQWVRSITFLDGEGALRDDVQHGRSAGRRQLFTEIGGGWLAIDDVQRREYQTTFSLRYSDLSAEIDPEAVVIALQLPTASIVRREIQGDGITLAFVHADIRRVYMAYLNGQALGADRVTLSGSIATFTTPPQPGDTIMLLGAL